MSLVVDVPAGYEPERRYILDVVLSDWLGLDWRLRVDQRSDLRITVDGDPSRGAVSAPDILFATRPQDWLTVRSLPSLPLATGTVGERPSDVLPPRRHLPVLYGARPGTGALVSQRPDGLRVHVDVFGGAFFMLTRYEELVRSDRDRYGRFPASASLAARAGFLRFPVVDAYVEVLWSALRRVWPRLRRTSRRFDVVLTHDVDDPLAILGRGPAQIGRQLAADLLVRRDLRLAARRARSVPAARRGDHSMDPYNTFDFLMDVSERHGRRSAFNFLATRDPDPREGRYRLEDPWIRSLIRRIHRRGHEVGLHGSFRSYRDPTQTIEEFSHLRAVAEAEGVHQARWGGRQHYLRWDNPVTWCNWDRAGLSYDSSVAYADAAGFRTGTCHPYRVFDLRRRRPLDLRELPFQVMDVTLFSYMSLSPECAHAVVMECAAACRRYGGSLGLLWHNSSLPTRREQGWYAALIAELVGG